MVSTTTATIQAVWRIESARLIAALARVVKDVGVAEELAQDAFVAALEQWPTDGVPDRPGAWLMATAQHRAIDRLRRGPMLHRSHTQIAAEARLLVSEDVEARFDAVIDRIGGDAIGDDLLRLMFVSCHPVLSTEARLALTLRLVGGLSVDEIARAFLLTEAAVAQRIVRAKRTLAAQRVPFEVPPKAQWPERVSSVLEVIYLIFNEGYSATRGDDWMRPGLCDDALRLARILAALMPHEPEAQGLAALLEIQASRSAARVGPGGEPVLLLEQNRSRWNLVFIRRGLAALARAEALATIGAAPAGPGPYTLQAAIAACHARASTAALTDWLRIAALYERLVAITGSPVVELNRAVAVAMAFGPAAGLVLVDALVADGALANYHLLPSVRGDLLARLGRHDEACAEFTAAAALTGNAREQAMLTARATACGR